MVAVSVEGDHVVFDVQASHKIWAFKSRLQIPLAHIKSVRRDPDPPMGWFDGIKWIGSDIPHVFRAGTFTVQGKRVFFDVRHPENTITIELIDEDYEELFIEVEHPEQTVQQLAEALRK